MRPENLVERVNGIVLSGGSAFGLEAAAGVMRYLEERGSGYPVGQGQVVPIVPAAVLFDLGRGGGDQQDRPTAEFGYQACLTAQGGEVAQGNVGAGRGAVAGRLKGGIGTASAELEEGVIVGAIVAVNSYGSPIDFKTGLPYAAYLEIEDEFGLTGVDLHISAGRFRGADPTSLQHTTIGVVATNGHLTKAQANRVAQMAQDGIARAIHPAHTMFDGDAIFVLATGEVDLPPDERGPFGAERGIKVTEIGSAASDVIARAIVHAILAAESSLGFTSYHDYLSKEKPTFQGKGDNPK